MTLYRQVIDIAEKHFHRGFRYETFNNDIGLLKLKESIDLNLYPPVCLPKTRLDEPDIPVLITGQFTQDDNTQDRNVSGWGLLGENTFDTPDELNELRLR